MTTPEQASVLAKVLDILNSDIAELEAWGDPIEDAQADALRRTKISILKKFGLNEFDIYEGQSE